MSSEVLVKAVGVSKKFCRSLKRSLWYGLQDVGAEVLGRTDRRDELRKNEFWALSDVSFELRRGECLGLIGPNGAGKSTMLKMLNGLVKPDKGKITMRGRVGALIELGAGFNPILTGRENIFVNGSVLGFSKKDISRKLDSIVAFAEVDEFLDTPVQNYSSGMKVRLGFAIAAQMEPDILLIDEVLAVGDAGFRTKCIREIARISPSTAIVFVSHSMPLIGRMCGKALLLRGGRRATATSDVPTNILEYHSSNKNQYVFILGDENLKVSELRVNGGEPLEIGGTVRTERFGRLSVLISIVLLKPLKDFQVNLVFLDQEEKSVGETFSNDLGFYVQGTSGKLSFQVEFDSLELNAGRYTLALGFIERKPDGSRGEIYYTQRGLINLLVGSESIGHSPVQFSCRWRLVDG